MTTTDHRTTALRHLEAAKAARLALDDAYSASRQDRAEIADLHQRIGFGLKVAEIHALLALAPLPPSGASAGFTVEQDADRGAALLAERYSTTSRLA